MGDEVLLLLSCMGCGLCEKVGGLAGEWMVGSLPPPGVSPLSSPECICPS